MTLVPKSVLTLGEVARRWPVVSQLFWRDFRLKYKRTVFGYFWSLLNPILNLAVLAIVFTQIIGRGVDNYTQFLFAGLLSWGFFEGVITFSMISYLENEGFIKKVSLPMIIFPIVKMLNRLFDFALTVLAMGVLGLIFSFKYQWVIVYFPLAVLLFSCFTLGVSLFLCASVVFFRDLDHLTNVGMRVLYFATPIMYPAESAPEFLQKWFRYNPLYHFIRLFQEILYYGTAPSLKGLAICSILALGSLFFGLWFTEKTQREMVFHM